MSQTSSIPDKPLPEAALRRVDDVCAQFEDAWRKGRRPRLDEFLARAGVAERAELLRELLRLELHYRRAAGERVAPDDYEGRFPDDVPLIRAVFADGMIVEGAPDEAPPDPFQTVQPASVPAGAGPPAAGDDPTTRTAYPAREPRARSAGATDLPPLSVGDHDILGELGHGGMGVVYRAV